MKRFLKHPLAWSFLIICTLFIFLRLPALIEPYWYGDEGIYEVIGQMMNNGSLLYRDAWDNKPPLLYMIYAFANGDQPSVKLIALLFGLGAVVAFFILSYRFFASSKTTVFVSGLFAFLFATPLVEGNIANAENFMLVFTIGAALLLYRFTKKETDVGLSRDILVFAGLLLGIGFLFKTVALFDFVGFAFFLLLMHLRNKKTWSQLVNAIPSYILFILPFVFGFLTPFLIAVISFASLHNVGAFIQAAFFDNVGYVGYENYFFGIEQGLLLLKLILLGASVIILFWKRNVLSKEYLFVITWLLFTLFSAFFSGRPYTHYVLVLIPSACLFIGLGLAAQKRRNKNIFLASSVILILTLGTSFLYYPAKAFDYYPNAVLFLTGQKDVQSYQYFFDYKTPRDYAIGEFIKKNTTETDNVYIWGDNAQIYLLSGKLPTSKYLDSYHLVQNNVAVTETQQAIEKAKPKYIVTLDEAQPLPFSLPLYIMQVRMPGGATIYERRL